MSLKMTCPKCADETSLSPILLRQLPKAVRCLACAHSFESVDHLKFEFSNQAQRPLSKAQDQLQIPPSSVFGTVGGGAYIQTFTTTPVPPKPARSPWQWAGLSMLILITCLLSLIHMRQKVVDIFPFSQKVFQAVLPKIGFETVLPESIDSIETEHSEIRYQSGLLEIQTFVRNQDDYNIAWPVMELELLDKEGKIMLRKILTPQEYLQYIQFKQGASNTANSVSLSSGILSKQEYLAHLFISYPLNLGQVFEYQLRFFYPNREQSS